MITTASGASTTRTAGRPDGDALLRAEQRMYDAETALHAARQTQVDAWISAAYDQLHVAIVAHSAAVRSAAVA
jgi:hypothetical protein